MFNSDFKNIKINVVIKIKTKIILIFTLDSNIFVLSFDIFGTFFCTIKHGNIKKISLPKY